MPVFDIIALTVIVGIFATFGAVLGWVSWYCADRHKRPKAKHRGHHITPHAHAHGD